MDLATLQTEVQAITKRPDLTAQTLSAVQKATLRLHCLDYWARDAIDATITWAAPAYQQSWNYKTGPSANARWRALRYAVKAASNGDPYGTPLQHWEPGIGTYDSYGNQKVDVFYQSGNSYLFQFSDLPPKLLVGGYLFPDVSSGGYTSWIADEHPYAIIYDAARTILSSIGFNDVAAQVAGDLAIEIANLKTTGVQAVGY